jgi:hypothetical protein
MIYTHVLNEGRGGLPVRSPLDMPEPAQPWRPSPPAEGRAQRQQGLGPSPSKPRIQR